MKWREIESKRQEVEVLTKKRDKLRAELDEQCEQYITPNVKVKVSCDDLVIFVRNAKSSWENQYLNVEQATALRDFLIDLLEEQ